MIKKLEQYINDIKDLIFNRDLHTNPKAQKIARSLTLILARQLDGDLQGSLLQFLYENDLIIGENPVIRITGIRFKDVDLLGVNATGINLRGCVMTDCDLSNADFSGAYLFGVRFDNTLVSGTMFNRADLSYANFRLAHKVNEAIFTDANLTDTAFPQPLV